MKDGHHSNTGLYVVLGIAAAAVLGVWAYNQYVKPKVDTINNATTVSNTIFSYL